MLFSSDCSAGTGPVIEPPGDARANVPQGPDGGCVEVGAALARARGHAGRGARGRSSGPARDGHAGLPVGRSSPSVATLARVGRFQEHRIRRYARAGDRPTWSFTAHRTNTLSRWCLSAPAPRRTSAAAPTLRLAFGQCGRGQVAIRSSSAACLQCHGVDLALRRRPAGGSCAPVRLRVRCL